MIALRASMLVLAVACALVAAGCGKSKEEKALATVCSARADIQKNVGELTSYSATTVTLNGVKGNLTAIQDDLKTIRDAQPDLGPTPKQQVSQALSSFGDAVTSSVKQLGTSLSISGLESNLKKSTSQLESSFQQALEPIDCNSIAP
ncbi:MAG: hypothetical protein ACRDKI_09800 [Solirubrobacterales bacterium]